MRRYGIATLLGSIVPLLVFSSFAQAQLTEYQWTGGTGSQDWQVDANWDLPGFPNDTNLSDTDYPTANLSVGLGADLNVSVGTTPIALAGLTLGGSSSAVTTEVSSGGPAGTITFKNNFAPEDGLTTTMDSDFDNDDQVTGSDFLIWQANLGFVNTGPDNINDMGDANDDDNVNDVDLGIWQDQYGVGTEEFNPRDALLRSGGVAGSINRITAPIHIDDDTLTIDAINPLTIDTGANISHSAADMESNAVLSVHRGVVTVNSNVNVTDVNTAPDTGGNDFTLRANGEGSVLILNGVVKDATNATTSNFTFGGGDGRVEIYGDNDLGGTVRTGGEILLGHNNALGVSRTDSGGNAEFKPSTVRPGGTYISDDDARDLPNKFILGSFLNTAGDKTLTLSGEITQTNNRGFNNNIESPGMLVLSGLLYIWEDDEALRREFDFTGTGTTKITGEILDDPQLSGLDRGLRQSGPGVTIIDVAAGNNSHSGDTIVVGGNLHYANNDSLNVGPGLISARGGAVGVDTGVANNTAFAARISPGSTGGLMLAASDATASLDFTGTLANAGNMTVAAPETDITFTGSINPANSTYGLGGGSGTITLPNAQLTGANGLVVRNGGVVELLGDNTYTGVTLIARGGNTLVVDDLANGGAASSIGSASSDAENLFIQGSTLRYIGAGDSTNRLFTIGTAGATINSSGSGAVVFSNSGVLGRDDAESRTGTLNDFTGQPNIIIDVADTSDIIGGMSVTDPAPAGGFDFTQAPCNPDGSNCIPDGTVVEGVTANSIGISNSFPFIEKVDTMLVFGTVERTLTLAGTNGNDNTIASVISDSAMGGVVSVAKVDSGTWVLSGSNTYTGDTTVEEGILSLITPSLDDDSTVNLFAGGILDLDTSSSTDVIGDLFIDGASQADGLWGALGNGAATFTTALITGSGLLSVGGAALSAVASVPEPNSVLLAAFACLGLISSRKRSNQS